MIALIYAHPYPDRSRANRVLLEAVRSLPGVQTRSLYDLYPDFAIDVAREQALLLEADTIVWQHPVYWYAAPALMKLWFEKVLAHGWAYGEGGTMLRGKRVLWVPTTGAPESGYAPSGMHGHPFGAFEPVTRQTAQFCGMKWLAPMVLHGAHRIDDKALAMFGAHYRERLIELGGATPVDASERAEESIDAR